MKKRKTTDWQKIVISESTPIIDVIQIIDHSGLRFAMVVNSSNQLVGTVTDGDIRRGLLKQIDTKQPIKTIMHLNPKVASRQDSKQDILQVMQKTSICHLPIVDAEQHILGLEILEELMDPSPQENYVVLMAGGLGSRLSPLTDNCPKPLLQINSKPMLQIIMENFAEYGFKKFFISLNYKASMIEEYFGDGSRFNFEIHYLHEDKKLGTAGALSLLPEMSQPIIVMNGDLLTKIHFQSLMDYHIKYQANATMCVKEFDFQVPYGVVRLDEHNNIIRIDEKPMQRFFVNAGIYVLSPEMLSLIEKNTYCDMPNLFSTAIEKNLSTISFPIREYWLDIGRPEDFVQAKLDYSEYF